MFRMFGIGAPDNCTFSSDYIFDSDIIFDWEYVFDCEYVFEDNNNYVVEDNDIFVNIFIFED